MSGWKIERLTEERQEVAAVMADELAAIDEIARDLDQRRYEYGYHALRLSEIDNEIRALRESWDAAVTA